MVVPRFNLLQNYRGGSAHLMYFAFDILVLKGNDVMKLLLSQRRELLRSTVKRGAHVDLAAWSRDLEPLERFAREHKLEGIVAKRADSLYESGRRSGCWVKERYNSRQEFVVGGSTPSYLGLDALLVGFYKGKDLRFAGAVRGGFQSPAAAARFTTASSTWRSRPVPSSIFPIGALVPSEKASPRRKWRSARGSNPSSLLKSNSPSGRQTNGCVTRLSWGSGVTRGRRT